MKSGFEVTLRVTSGLRLIHALPWIFQMTPFASACDLPQSFENKGFNAFHAETTGEPNWVTSTTMIFDSVSSR